MVIILNVLNAVLLILILKLVTLSAYVKGMATCVLCFCTLTINHIVKIINHFTVCRLLV